MICGNAPLVLRLTQTARAPALARGFLSEARPPAIRLATTAQRVSPTLRTFPEDVGLLPRRRTRPAMSGYLAAKGSIRRGILVYLAIYGNFPEAIGLGLLARTWPTGTEFTAQRAPERQATHRVVVRPGFSGLILLVT